MDITKKENNRSQQSPCGFVRIIGGKWKGRKLEVLNSPGLRPTGDRMKETLFNWLMHDIVDSHCLDLFAGSGSLGFEAASRGAASVTLIEKHKKVAETLSYNASKLKSTTLHILNKDAFEFISTPPATPFDVIFLDPPFHQGILDNLLNDLLDNGFIAKGGLVYLEAEKNTLIQKPNDLALIKEKVSGQVMYQLLINNNITPR